MGSSIYFPVSALAFSALTTIIFFIKKPIKSIETKIYKYLLISNFCGLIIELLCTYAASIVNVNPFLSDFILKLYLVYNVQVKVPVFEVFLIYLLVQIKLHLILAYE